MNDKGTILIVEDQQGFRRIYEDLLTNEGYSVLTAEDGEKGWEMAKEQKPHVVLLDLGLPKMDGFEVLQKLRADEATKAVPVIIFSVMGEEKEIKRAMALGANDYTVKGFYTPRQILSKIKGLVTKSDTIHGPASFKLGIKEKTKDASKLELELGLVRGFRCPECDVEMNLELFPDHVKDGGHWFLSRLQCPQCGKAF